ncbi:MAG TPA: hypothetical protein VMB79_06880 [Jatrophihabitans sp.]|nr:hypothetical protein [Jatrophihabitans sp.]
MREATISAAEALRERLTTPGQLDPAVQESAMPPYMEMFLARLRLLLGVPFGYLVPDARLLPSESIRFFYLDRSWTDRLVDGAIAVGKTGSREQAHHQAHSADVQSAVDTTERTVRATQRGITPVTDNAPANVLTGFLLRSAAVSGWPAMDVRAFSTDLGPNPTQEQMNEAAIPTLRQDRLSPAVLFALFDGIPQLVWLEEPHHGVQFGVNLPSYTIPRHTSDGSIEPSGQEITVPVRQANPRVLAIQQLRDLLYQDQLADASLIQQTGSAALAISLLALPWRQRFQGLGGDGGQGGFVADFPVAQRVSGPTTTVLEGLL